jgi:hypothetical protein
VLNTSDTAAHLVTVNLRRESISGATLPEGHDSSVALGTIEPGESKTAHFRLIAQRTGWISFTNLTADDGLTGSFDLTMGVDERGVILSPRSISYPHWVRELPDAVQRAANRVLGQALSISTAGYLPPGVRRVEPETVERKVTELAEAGQRLKYGDNLESVLLDLLLDWQGARSRSLAFDQILRETNAGAELREAVVASIQSGGSLVNADFIESRRAAIAGRHEDWGVAATNSKMLSANVRVGGVFTGTRAIDVTETNAYQSDHGWVVPRWCPS